MSNKSNILEHITYRKLYIYVDFVNQHILLFKGSCLKSGNVCLCKKRVALFPSELIANVMGFQQNLKQYINCVNCIL